MKNLVLLVCQQNEVMLRVTEEEEVVDCDQQSDRRPKWMHTIWSALKRGTIWLGKIDHKMYEQSVPSPSQLSVISGLSIDSQVIDDMIDVFNICGDNQLVDNIPKECRVCGRNGPKDQIGYKYGGGLSCNACRLVFKNHANNEQKRTTHKNCELSLQERQSCIACRLRKCFDNKMDPSLIDQRKRTETKTVAVIEKCANTSATNALSDPFDIYLAKTVSLIIETNTTLPLHIRKDQLEEIIHPLLSQITIAIESIRLPVLSDMRDERAFLLLLNPQFKQFNINIRMCANIMKPFTNLCQSDPKVLSFGLTLERLSIIIMTKSIEFYKSLTPVIQSRDNQLMLPLSQQLDQLSDICANHIHKITVSHVSTQTEEYIK
ncbi:unnamed protein product [Medioppia subpectinata]|uniref:Nuclear receptor domain-containing protein n=1 Tax=Medioppia subpectinata TaxID=1979941 RepID=A0A7R9KYS1_9ACAR|nr:unnamed protein product [Medioppia subpectinata]CAG2112354.1 unnamed protein product [Medioppia subpectinata]